MAADYLAPHFDRAALLLIDIQHDFIDGAMPVPGTDRILPALAQLANAFRHVRRPIVHAIRLYEPGSSDTDAVRRAAIETGAKIVAPGTSGAQIPASLLPEGRATPLDAELLMSGASQQLTTNESVLYKPRWSAFYRTSLDEQLRGLGVDTLVVAGCNLPNCPRATLFDATERDYRTVLVTDAVSQCTTERLADLELIGVQPMSLSDLRDALTAVRG